MAEFPKCKRHGSVFTLYMVDGERVVGCVDCIVEARAEKKQVQGTGGSNPSNTPVVSETIERAARAACHRWKCREVWKHEYGSPETHCDIGRGLGGRCGCGYQDTFIDIASAAMEAGAPNPPAPPPSPE